MIICRTKRKTCVKIGVVACNVLRRELERVLAGVPEVVEVIYLDGAIHVYPRKLKETIKERIDSLKGKVDVIFLGYGYCQSLKGIEEEVDVPVILPQVDDCIALLLTPERYAEEIKKEVGTWFMTPGWTEIGFEMICKDLRLERIIKLGKDPLEMARRLFTHYRRGLYIDTGVGDDADSLAKAEDFCRDFRLTMEKCVAESNLLKE